MPNDKKNLPETPRNGGSMRKRQQIDTSNRLMFLWVAGASVIVAFALVISIFAVQKGLFNEKVLMKKGEAAKTLEENIKNAKTLNKAVNDLRGDRNIGKVPSSTSSSNNLDKILDALPYEGDSVALGSSLQTTLLGDAAIESLTVDSVSAEGGSASSGIDTTALTPIGNSQPISFSFKVTGSDEELKKVFEKLDRSIRPIKVVSLQLQAAGNSKITATVIAVTYYQPLKVFELKEEAVKP